MLVRTKSWSRCRERMRAEAALASILLGRTRQLVLDLDRDMVVLLPNPALEQGDRAASHGDNSAGDGVEQKLMSGLQGNNIRQTHDMLVQHHRQFHFGIPKL